MLATLVSGKMHDGPGGSGQHGTWEPGPAPITPRRDAPGRPSTRTGQESSEDSDVFDVFVPPGPAVAQRRELFFHRQHPGDTHHRHRNAVKPSGVLTERIGGEGPVRPSSLQLSEGAVRSPVEIGRAEGDVIPDKFARFFWRLGSQRRRAGTNQSRLRPDIVRSGHPELDIAVATSNPPDPGIEPPPAEQPDRDRHPCQHRERPMNQAQLSLRASIHDRRLCPPPRPRSSSATDGPPSDSRRTRPCLSAAESPRRARRAMEGPTALTYE